MSKPEETCYCMQLYEALNKLGAKDKQDSRRVFTVPLVRCAVCLDAIVEKSNSLVRENNELSKQLEEWQRRVISQC